MAEDGADQVSVPDDTSTGGEHTAENHRGQQDKDASPPLWEWVVALIGFVFVFGVIGFMLYRAIQGNSSPPELTVQVESTLATSNGYLITFVVTNGGELTAAGVTIQGELRNGTERVEMSTVTLDYVPSRSQRRGGLYFINNPQQYELQLWAQGYEQP
jgi:uncharacterized protein (TIGR02588 family)